MAFRRRTEPYSVVELYEYAVGALGRRARTVAELKRLLRQRVGGPNGDSGETMIQVVIDKLKEQRYLNDTEYATSYSALRREHEKLGRRRIITDLKAKGVHGDIIEKTVAAAYDGVDEEAQARQYLARKRLRKPADDKQAARVFRTLLRAGFTTRTIIGILKNWDVEDEVITALEGEEEG
jgi:regulatory protein